MSFVNTPDGWGEVLREQSAHGRTSYLVKGAGFEGWYDGLQVTSDFSDQPDEIIPNDDNKTTLPYPSRPQGPGWDGTNSTIQPDIDPHLERGVSSDSLTGESTGEDPVDADIEGLFEPPSRLAGVRPHRVHFATLDDPILDVSTIPGDSPVGLENSPINPDSVDTDDLFDGSLPHFERESAVYDRLVIEDDLSFMRYSADDDKKKKKHHEQDDQPGFLRDDDDDDSDDDGDDSDSGGDGDGGGSHTASAFSLALSTTADLHFLANLCRCAEVAPMHSKSEHREAFATPDPESTPASEREPANGVTPQRYDQGELDDMYRQNQLGHPAPLDLVDHTPALEDGDGADLYNHYASVQKRSDGYDKYIGGSDGHYYLIASGNGKLPKGEHYGHYESYEDAHDAVEAVIARNHAHGAVKTAAPAAADPNAQPTQIESQIEQLMQFWAVDNNGWWHWTGSQSDLALLNQMQQQMMAVGMPGGPPGQMQAQSKTAAPALLAVLPELAEGGAAAEAGGAAAEGGAAEGGGAKPAGGMGNMMPGGGQHKEPESLAAKTPFTTMNPDGSTSQHQGAFVVESNTPAPWREYLQTIASDRLVALAAWKDVVQKSKRLRAEGAIDVEAFKPDVITAYVQGDHGRYYTTVQRLGSVEGMGRQGLTSTQVSGWSCDCEWGNWAWLRKRSFVGRMCSHAYALFSEMRSLDAKKRRGVGNGKPVGGGVSLASTRKTSWSRSKQGFEWVTANPESPTAAIVRTAAGWNAQIWSDGTAEDSLDAGVFPHSEQARRVASRIITAHLKLADSGDVDLVGNGEFSPGQSTGYDNTSPFADDGSPETVLDQQDEYDSPTGPGIQDSSTKTGSLSVFAEHDDGQDDSGPEKDDDGIEEEDPEDESLDEEIADDEDDSDDGDDDEGDQDDDGGHDEPHKRDDDDDKGTDNPGDDSDDEGIEKHSSVAELQAKFGLTHLAGANYSLVEQDKLVREGEGKTARNHGDLNLVGTHYEAATTDSPEDVLSFLN